MSSVTGISGSLLGAIAKSEKGSSSETSKSTLLGKEVSTSFDSVSFSSDLFKQAFADSYIRINSALNVVRNSDEMLDKLMSITDELLKIAHRSAQRNVTDGERATMETRFQKLIIKFKQTVEKANSQGIDFLDKDELAQVLKTAGIDLTAATALAEQFSKIAGSNEKIGRHSVKREDEVIDDGTSTISASVTVFNPDPFVADPGLGTYDSFPGIIPPGSPATPGAAGDGTFRGSISTSSVTSPWGITVGDYNHDGLDDLVALSQTNDTVSILLGNGDGTFQAATSMATGDNPLQVRTGDVDGDTNQDLIAINETDGTISVFLGNGDGTFVSQAVYTAAAGGASLKDIQLGDLDNDGDTDIITSDVNNDQVSILINNGNGTFNARVSLDTTGHGYGTALVDLNNDGNLDLAYSDWSNNVLNVQLGDGSGNFGVITSYAAAGGYEISFGDFNGDGNSDIAVASYDVDKLTVLLGNGNGTLKAAVSYASNDKPGTMTAVDFNGDGLTDVALGNALEDYSTVYLANSDGSFKASKGVYLSSDAHPGGVVSGDFNEDGVVDLVFSDVDDANLTVHFGHSSVPTFEADGSYDAMTSINIGGNVYDTQFADIENDGILDLISTDQSSGTLWVQTGNGDGTFKSGTSYGGFGIGSELYLSTGDTDGDGYNDISVSDSSGLLVNFTNNHLGSFTASATMTPSSGTGRMQLVDVTGDGDLDLVGRGNNAGDIFVYRGNGNGTFNAVISFADGVARDNLVMTDIDGDGKIDIVSADSNDNQVSILHGNGNGTFSVLATLAAYDPSAVTVNDFNADGVSDVFVVQRGSVHGEGVVYLGNSGGATYSGPVTYSVGDSPDMVYSGDYNGDGIKDILVSHTDKYGTMLLGNGDGSFRTGLSFTTGVPVLGDSTFTPLSDFFSGINPSAIATGDLNHDGHVDLALLDDSSTFHIHFGYGDGTFVDDWSYSIPGSTQDIKLGDMNGDGNLDVITGNNSGSELFINFGNSDGSFQDSVSFSSGATLNFITLADVNNDRKQDILVAAGFTGYMIHLSNGDGTFAGPYGVDSGTNPQQIAVADFNNDGFLDIAGANYSSAYNSVALGNGNGTFKTPITMAGNFSEGSITTGDFNGDGRADYATASESTNEVLFYYGNGDGAFSSALTFGVGTTPHQILAIDLNNDGADDILTEDEGDYVTSIYISNGDGTFQARATVPGGQYYSLFTVDDLNEDGVLDIVGTSYSDSYVRTSLQGVASAAGAAGFALADIDDDGVVDIVSSGGDSSTINIVHADSRIAQDGTGQFQFGSQTKLSGSSVSDGIVKGDLNRDGIEDIVVGGGGVGKAYVMMGHADGTFAKPVSYAINSFAGGGTLNLELADFNNDGRLDLLSPVANNSAFSIAFGNGDGSFGPNKTFDVGGLSYVAHSADIDGDGNVDVVSGGGAGGNLVVRLGNGNGTFAASTTLTGSGFGSVTEFSIADFNGDGKLDIAGNNSSGYLQVYRGNGDGTFKARTSYASLDVGAYATSSAVEDLNGDGYNDLIIGADNYATAAVFLGNGDGSFKAFTSFHGGDGYSRMRLEDLNDDGVKDLISTGIENVAVNFGNADGSFGAATTFKTGVSGPADLVVHDFNNDSVKDFIVVNSDDNSVSTFFGLQSSTSNTGNGYYQSVTRVSSVGADQFEISTADFNDDGILDYATIAASGNRINIGLGNGDGSFNAPVSYVTTTTADLNILSRDVNGDGKMDIVTVGQDFGVFLGNGDGTFGAQITHTGGDSYEGELRDFNRDGNLDLVTTDGTAGKVLVSYGNGNGTFGAFMTYSLSGAADIQGLTTGDFNNDGIFDIAASEYSTTVDTLYVLLGNSNGTFKAATTIHGQQYAAALESVDINSDGIADLVTTNKNNGNIGVLLGNGNGSFKALASFYASSSPLYDLAFGDGNGDGWLDVVATGGGGTYYLESYGTGNLSWWSQYFGGAGVATAFSDLNNDGALDITALRLGSGDVESHLGIAAGENYLPGGFMQERAISTLPWSASYTPDRVVSGDINHDGKLDVFFTSTTGNIGVMLGNGNATFQSPTVLTTSWGTNNTPIKLSDVNGDGSLDYVYVNSNSDQLSIGLGNGDGTFKAEVSAFAVQPGGHARSIDFADVNADGDLDLIAADGTNSVLSVSFGNGDGTFEAATSYAPATVSVATATIGDFTGDGIADIVVAGYVDIAQILVGSSDGTFTLGATFSNDNYRSPQAADFNNDGMLDVVFGDPGDFGINFGNGDGSFQAAQYFSTGQSSYPSDNLRAEDFNGDGIVDIITADDLDNTVSLFVNNGNGTFKSRISYATDSSGTSLAIGDFSGDGKNDILRAAYDGQHLGLLINTISSGYVGSYSSGTTYVATGGRVETLSAADFNEDGNVDILINGSSGINMQIAFGNGDNTVAWIGVYGAFSAGNFSTVADFNNDGHADIFSTDTTDSFVLLGNGDGTFSSSDSWATNPRVSEGQVSDIDGDGKLDIISANYNGGISVYLGHGDGTFDPEVSYDTGGGRSTSIDLADLNHDGKSDAVVMDYYHRLQIALGNGDGSFGAFTDYGDIGNGGLVRAADINRDGNLDVIASNGSGIAVRIGNGDGSIGGENFVGFGSWDFFVIDDNNDGLLDIVGSNGTSQLIRALGNGDGTFKAAVTYPGPSSYGGAVARADLNSDGIMDMLVGDYGEGTVTSFLGGLVGGTGSLPSADGTFELSNQLTFPNKTGMSAAADFNGDGFIDLAVEDTSGLAITLGNGDGSFKAIATLAEGAAGESLVARDVNGDSIVDLLLNDSSDNVYSVYLGVGDGTFGARTSFAGGDIGSGNNFILADLDGDTNLDIAGANLNDNSYSVLLGNGDGAFKAKTDFAIGSSGVYSVAAGLITGDADTDLVITANDNVVILQGNGNGTFNAIATMAAGTGTNFVTLSDLDGDSDLDIVASNSSSNNVSVMLSNGDGTFKSAVNYNTGASPDLIKIGDFDSDGVNDLVVENAGDETFSVLLGVGNGTFDSAVSYDVGTAAHGISVADFDGDTLNDLAVSAHDDNAVKIYHGGRVGETGNYSSISSSTTVSSIDSAQGGVFNDPLKDLSVRTRAKAIMAEKTLKKIKSDIAGDLEHIRGVEDQLKKALQFAIAGAGASDSIGASGSAISLAQSIAQRLSQQGVNVEQQTLDTKLVSDLLSD